jgi:hypothetical protein
MTVTGFENHDEEPSGVRRTYLPTEWQCALLIILLIQAREKEFERKGAKRKITRARISQNTIRKLCVRGQLSSDFLLGVQEHLLVAGWALFCVGPTHFAVIKVESVLGWGRVSSKRIANELGQVGRGSFPWREHEHLLVSTRRAADQVDGEDQEPEDESA